MTTWSDCGDDDGAMEFAEQFCDNPRREDIPLSSIVGASDCRKGFKPDCEDKHDLTKKSAQAYIRDMSDSMRGGGCVPPIVVDEQKGGKFWLRDGHHRVTAARDAGLTHALAIVISDG